MTACILYYDIVRLQQQILAALCCLLVLSAATVSSC